MALVPKYWHCETTSDGSLFEHVPWGQIRPEPSMQGTVFVNTATGEVYCDAILMCALPWPRFRVFGTGKQVVLPEWMAKTLEGLKSVLNAADLKDICPNGVCEGSKRSNHLRVETVEGKCFVTVHCNCTFRHELVGGPELNIRLPHKLTPIFGSSSTKKIAP